MKIYNTEEEFLKDYPRCAGIFRIQDLGGTEALNEYWALKKKRNRLYPSDFIAMRFGKHKPRDRKRQEYIRGCKDEVVRVLREQKSAITVKNLSYKMSKTKYYDVCRRSNGLLVTVLKLLKKEDKVYIERRGCRNFWGVV
jgi:hypothetical protein